MLLSHPQPPTTSPHTVVMRTRGLCSVRETPGIVLDCQKILESVGDLNDRVRGPLDKSTNRNTIFPFVFLLGNHSSGKSSFVNYLLNRRVQTAGTRVERQGALVGAHGTRRCSKWCSM